MPHYMLAVHSGGPPPDQHDTDTGPPDPGAMATMMQRIAELEEQLDAAGAWVFSGRLADPDTATVVAHAGGDTAITDGPYLETKEHLAGFYLIEAADLDEALDWADRVTTCVGAPIELRPFLATGHVRDQLEVVA